MTERDFLKIYKKTGTFKSIKEAKEKLELFWKTLLIGLEKEEYVIFKGWGNFKKEKKQVHFFNDNKVISYEKTVIKFKAGKKLNEIMNKGDKNE